MKLNVRLRHYRGRGRWNCNVWMLIQKTYNDVTAKSDQKSSEESQLRFYSQCSSFRELSSPGSGKQKETWVSFSANTSQYMPHPKILSLLLLEGEGSHCHADWLPVLAWFYHLALQPCAPLLSPIRVLKCCCPFRTLTALVWDVWYHHSLYEMHWTFRYYVKRLEQYSVYIF